MLITILVKHSTDLSQNIAHTISDTTLEFSMGAHKTKKGREMVKKGAFRFYQIFYDLYECIFILLSKNIYSK